MSWEKLPFVRSEILGLFVNALIVDGKYSSHSCENLPQQIQMKISQNPLPFWNLHQISSILKKTDESPSLSISEIIDSEIGGYLNL